MDGFTESRVVRLAVASDELIHFLLLEEQDQSEYPDIL